VAEVAGGKTAECSVTEPVTVCWQDRETECRAVVLPGAFPRTGMDLMVDPQLQAGVGTHGDKVYYMVK
jgi:hypothetical protein